MSSPLFPSSTLLFCLVFPLHLRLPHDDSRTSVIISSDFTSAPQSDRQSPLFSPPCPPPSPFCRTLSLMLSQFSSGSRSCCLPLFLSWSDSFVVLCDFTLLALTLSPRIPYCPSLPLLLYAILALSSSLSLLSVSCALCPQLNSFDVVLHMLAKSFCIADVPQPHCRCWLCSLSAKITTTTTTIARCRQRAKRAYCLISFPHLLRSAARASSSL